MKKSSALEVGLIVTVVCAFAWWVGCEKDKLGLAKNPSAHAAPFAALEKLPFAEYANTNLPSDYSLVCSSDGLYTVKDNKYDIVYNTEMFVTSNRLEAVRTAWEFHGMDANPTPERKIKRIERNWKECEK